MSESQPAPPRQVELLRDGERLALAIDGAVQSVAVTAGGTGGGYWPAMLPDRPPRESLLLGLGGGTLVHLLTGTFGLLPIVGVDDDPAVVALGRAHFGLDLPHLEIALADAYAYAATCSRRFDLVCVDLYRDGAIAPGATAPRFLRDVARLLRPTGSAVFNLARDRQAGNRLRRLAAHFVVARRILVGFNLVVHCLPLAALDELDVRRPRRTRARRGAAPVGGPRSSQRRRNAAAERRNML